MGEDLRGLSKGVVCLAWLEPLPRPPQRDGPTNKRWWAQGGGRRFGGFEGRLSAGRKHPEARHLARWGVQVVSAGCGGEVEP